MIPFPLLFLSVKDFPPTHLGHSTFFTLTSAILHSLSSILSEWRRTSYKLQASKLFSKPRHQIIYDYLLATKIEANKWGFTSTMVIQFKDSVIWPTNNIFRATLVLPYLTWEVQRLKLVIFINFKRNPAQVSRVNTPKGCCELNWSFWQSFTKFRRSFWVTYLGRIGRAGSLAGCVRKEVCQGVKGDFELSWGNASLLQY